MIKKGSTLIKTFKVQSRKLKMGSGIKVEEVINYMIKSQGKVACQEIKPIIVLFQSFWLLIIALVIENSPNIYRYVMNIITILQPFLNVYHYVLNK